MSSNCSRCQRHENKILRKHHNEDQITWFVSLSPLPTRTRHAHCLICYERITRPNKPIDENLRDACSSLCSSDISLKPTAAAVCIV